MVSDSKAVWAGVVGGLAVLRWLSKRGRLHHTPMNSVYQSTKWTHLELIGNLSLDIFLASSFVNDFRALARATCSLASWILQSSVSWWSGASTVQEGCKCPVLGSTKESFMCHSLNNRAREHLLSPHSKHLRLTTH